MRELFGVPIPENLEDLQTLTPARVRAGIRRLNPPARSQVLAHMRKELEYAEQVARRRGPEAARQAVVQQLKGYGFRIRPGEEAAVYALALRWIRAILDES